MIVQQEEKDKEATKKAKLDKMMFALINPPSEADRAAYIKADKEAVMERAREERSK